MAAIVATSLSTNRLWICKNFIADYTNKACPISESALAFHAPDRVRGGRAICVRFLAEKQKEATPDQEDREKKYIQIRETVASHPVDDLAWIKFERYARVAAAVMLSFGITSLGFTSLCYRFRRTFKDVLIPISEVIGTSALSTGAAIAMEFWARWAHRDQWHASLWPLHQSHHNQRDGLFELNDVFPIINAIPAISLMAYGINNSGILPRLCWGVGLGITIFGMAYMFIHDGLVHARFPVGPLVSVPYFKRVAAAHHIHHLNKFRGVPYGLFLGPNELVEVGGIEELNK